MIIDKNSDSSVDLVDWLRRSSDESEQLARTNRLDSARIADVYKTTGEKLVLNITYNKSTGIMTIYYKDGSTLDIYVGTDNNLDDYVTYPDLDSAIADLESKIPSSTSDLTNDSDFVNSTQVDERIKEVVGAAPEALDTLQELGKALNNDPDFASTITNQIAEVKSLIPSVEGLASEKYVNNKVAAVEAKIPSIEGLATESYVGQTRHDIEKWVEEQGYLTEHQDISNLVTKSELAEVESKIPSIDGLASIQYVDDKVASIEIPEVDLDPYITKDEVSSNYALKSELPSIDGLASESWVEEKIAEIQLGGDVDVTTLATKSELAAVEAKIPSIDGLASTQYVDEKIEAIEHPTVDLDPYLTKEEAEGKYAVKSDIPSLDGLATEEWVEGKGYLTEHQDISNLATKDELSSVENKIPSIEGLASQSYVDEAIAKIEHPDVDLTPYAKTEDVNKSISEVEAKMPSIEGLATESFVTEAIEAIEHPTVDLTPYAKKEDIPSIEGLASTQYVDDAIANIQMPEVPEVDLTPYATKTYVDEKIESIEHPSVDLDPYLTKEDAELTYATKDELPSIDGLATQTYVDEAIANIEHPTVDLTDYAKKEDIPSIEGLASETYVDEAIKSIEHPTVDLTGYATEEWVESKGYLTEHQDISQLATISYVENKADEVEAKIPSMEPYATRAWVEETIAGMESGEVDHTVFALKTDLEGLASESYVRAQIAAIEPTDLSGLATKEELSSAVEGLASTQYVDEKIEAIEHPTVDMSAYATKDEVNSKIAALNSSFQWKDNVVSFEDIAKIYPDPKEGFSVYVDDEQTTYVYMGGEWVATGTSTDDEIPQATEELDGLMPAEAMRKLNSLENYDDSQLQGSVLSIEAQLAILADKVSALSKTNIEVVSPSMSAASFNDATKDYAIQGEVTTRFVVSGSKSISMTDTKITNDAKVTLKSTGDVELKNVYTEGEFTKTNSNCIVNIPEASSVVIKDMTVQSTQYNGIEIGLNSSVLPKSVIIDNCKFDGNFSNNVISIHGVQDNAVINISNCKFSSVSNPLRLSNFTNAKNITINITNCSCDKWESGAYAGFMLCQDSTSASVEEVAINNMFSEVTINFINFTMPGGVKLTKPEDIATLCGTGNDQLIYVYANALSKADNTYVTTPYGDGSAYPTINII